MSIKTRVDRAERESGADGPFDLSLLSDEELLKLHGLVGKPDRSAEETAEAERIADKCRR
jgi:hypothetical protein